MQTHVTDTGTRARPDVDGQRTRLCGLQLMTDQTTLTAAGTIDSKSLDDYDFMIHSLTAEYFQLTVTPESKNEGPKLDRRILWDCVPAQRRIHTVPADW